MPDGGTRINDKAVSPALAELRLLAEIQRRRECRRSLLAWCTEALAPFGQTPAVHHRLLIAELQAVADGLVDRLMIFMPPGSGKSKYTTQLFPAWLLSRRPGAQLIGASHTAELADDFSGKIQGLITENSATLGYGLRTRAMGRWYTTNDGAYLAAGVRGAIPGFRADGAIIDDPIKGRAAADSASDRKNVWDWYNGDLERRLTPNSFIVLMHCMVGDTRVLMADGTEKALRDTKVGDAVATYKHGRLSSSTVLNWANQGLDIVFAIRTVSGIIVKANERHPFLVERDGERKWIRLRELRIGDGLLSVKAHGAASCAPPKDATNQSVARAIARHTTEKPVGQTGSVLRLVMPSPIVRPTYGTATVLTPQSMTHSLPRKTESVPSVESFQWQATLHRAGADCALITTLPQDGSGGFSATAATAATSWSDTAQQKKSCSAPFDTYEITPDPITEIIPSGREDVFDIEVAETENFIANGLISHNTRWHKDDLAGRLLEAEAHRWRVLSLPAEAEANDPLGRAPGEWLWSDDAYGYGAGLARIKQSLSERAASREWSSQYQQHPVPDSGNYFKRDWLRSVPSLPPRDSLRVFGASDYAVTADGGDWTVHIVVGVDSDDRLYVLDLWRDQASSDQWVEAFCDLVIRWKPMGWAEETGQIRAGIGPWLDRRSRERRAFVARQTFPTRGDKSVRAQSIRGRMALNGLYVAADAPWRADFEAELLSFPAGKHDDQVDALGLIGMLLDILLPPPGPPADRPPEDTWDRAFRRSSNPEDPDGWKTA